MHFQVRNKPYGTPFSLFLSDCEAPKRRVARDNSPFSPPLDGPVDTHALGHARHWSINGCIDYVLFNAASSAYQALPQNFL